MEIPDESGDGPATPPSETPPEGLGAATPRRRGRPARDVDRQVYKALLATALSSLERAPYASLSVRDIAFEADTNAAMINYYFGGKEGLFLALVEQMFEDIRERLARLEQTVDDNQDPPTRLLANLILAAYVRWNPVLTLFSSDVAVVGRKARQAFRNRLASTLFNAMKAFLGSMSARGHFRRDLDLEVTAVMLSGLLVFPFHFSPLINAAGELTWQEGNRQRWRDYIERMLNGVLC